MYPFQFLCAWPTCGSGLHCWLSPDKSVEPETVGESDGIQVSRIGLSMAVLCVKGWVSGTEIVSFNACLVKLLPCRDFC